MDKFVKTITLEDFRNNTNLLDSLSSEELLEIKKQDPDLHNKYIKQRTVMNRHFFDF